MIIPFNSRLICCPDTRDSGQLWARILGQGVEKGVINCLGNRIGKKLLEELVRLPSFVKSPASGHTRLPTTATHCVLLRVVTFEGSSPEKSRSALALSVTPSTTLFEYDIWAEYEPSGWNRRKEISFNDECSLKSGSRVADLNHFDSWKTQVKK